MKQLGRFVGALVLISTPLFIFTALMYHSVEGHNGSDLAFSIVMGGIATVSVGMIVQLLVDLWKVCK